MNVRPLQVEPLALDVEAAAIAAQRSAGCDHAVAGDDDGDWIPIVGHADGAEGLRVSDGAGNIGIGAGLAVGDREQRLPAGEWKRSSAKIERHRKFVPLTGEVLVQFAEVGREGLFGIAKLNCFGVHLHDARFKLEAYQAFCRRGEEERTDRRSSAEKEQRFHDDGFYYDSVLKA